MEAPGHVPAKGSTQGASPTDAFVRTAAPPTARVVKARKGGHTRSLKPGPRAPTQPEQRAPAGSRRYRARSSWSGPPAVLEAWARATSACFASRRRKGVTPEGNRCGRLEGSIFALRDQRRRKGSLLPTPRRVSRKLRRAPRPDRFGR